MKTKFNRRATGCTAAVQCTPLHGQEKRFHADILLLFARSVDYTRVIQANDQLLTPENRYIDVSTRVVPGHGTHELKIEIGNRDVPLKSGQVATLRMTSILNTSIAPTIDDRPMPCEFPRT